MDTSLLPKFTKTILMVLAGLLFVAPSRSFAEIDIAPVSKELAKELGIEIRATPNGPNEIWVKLEFKPSGQLKDFNHVSLEIRDGEKLLVGYAALQEKRSDSGSIVVEFMANRAYLDKVTLEIVVGSLRGRSGYDLSLKDFVELRKDAADHTTPPEH